MSAVGLIARTISASPSLPCACVHVRAGCLRMCLRMSLRMSLRMCLRMCLRMSFRMCVVVGVRAGTC